jgi:hypothetical protein
MRYVVPWAGLLLAVVGSGCAGRQEQQAASSPAARRVAASQEESEKALQEAREAQRKASEQAKRAATAQDELAQEQRRLIDAQQRAEREQEKARQLQAEAYQAMQRASDVATPAQQEALQSMATQLRRIERGEGTILGQVTSASAEEIVVRPPVGETMKFRVTDDTRVQIDGRESSAARIRQGEDARVSYQIVGNQPVAIAVKVMSGELAPRGTQQPGGGAPQGGEEEPAPESGQQPESRGEY